MDINEIALYRKVVGGKWVHWTNYAGWFQVDPSVFDQYQRGLKPRICDRMEDNDDVATTIRVVGLLSLLSACVVTIAALQIGW